MLHRKFLRTGSIIAQERHVSAIQDPILSIQLVVNSGQCKCLVIAHEADHVCTQPRLEIHDVINYATAISAPVDVVVNEDEPHRPSVCFALTFGYETTQGTQRAVNIANGIDPLHTLASFARAEARSGVWD